MPFIDIDSTSITALANLGLPSILLKRVESIKGDYQDLFHPIQIATTFPDGRFYQSFFHPSGYFSLKNSHARTDLPIDLVIHYCAFTNLKIHAPDKDIRFRITYASAGNDNLDILVKNDLDGYIFSLSQNSLELIYSLNREAVPAKSVSVSYPVKDKFPDLYGKIFSHVLPALTGLSIEELDRIKVKTLIDAISNEEIQSF